MSVHFFVDEGGKALGSQALAQTELALETMGMVDSTNGQTPNRMQQFATAVGSKMYLAGQKLGKKNHTNNLVQVMLL